jgi:hypothetical protein
MPKKIIQITPRIMLLLMLFSGCSKDTDVKEPFRRMKLGAYYFDGWAGKCPYDDGTDANAWAKGMPTHFTKKLATTFSGRKPIWGWRDDTKAIMEQQIDLAADHGIAFFAFCWYWSTNQGPINVPAIESDSKHTSMYQFMNAENNDKMEFCLLVANHQGAEIIGDAAWKQAANYWIKLFKYPRYLKTGGKPLIIIFSPSGVDKAGLAYLQESAKAAGFPGVAVAYCGNGKPEDGFTLRTHYNIIPGNGNHVSEPHPYQELVNAHMNAWNGSIQQPYIPVATVGWDRRPWESPDGFGSGSTPTWYFEGNTPLAVESFINQMAIWMEHRPANCTSDKLALIYAWNEIGEGGWLVPCTDDPKGELLDAIKRVVENKESM